MQYQPLRLRMIPDT